jgi:hypothetical protein
VAAAALPTVIASGGSTSKGAQSLVVEDVDPK